MESFKITIKDSVLADLQERLKKSRWTDEPEANSWAYGSNTAFLKELIKYWQTSYDWRKQEATLNSYPQFKTIIDGVEIHFVYIKSKGIKAKPLLLAHGWPDSFYRFYKAIPLLTNPDFSSEGESFDVIIPSIPGFGFSSKVALNDSKVAVIFQKLMTEVLAYNIYFAAGGDIGSGIIKEMALTYPNSLFAIHLTDVGYPTGYEDKSNMSNEELEFCQFIQNWWYSEGAYSAIQSTKPQTLGYALNDSPIGLASWMIEKYNSWSDNRGNIENSFSKDELLTQIMIYWVTETINTSMRMYSENAKASYGEFGPNPPLKVEVPTGVASFPSDAPLPKDWANRMVNLKKYTKYSNGGHFAAMEVPELWAKELRDFFLHTNF